MMTAHHGRLRRYFVSANGPLELTCHLRSVAIHVIKGIAPDATRQVDSADDPRSAHLRWVFS